VFPEVDEDCLSAAFAIPQELDARHVHDEQYSAAVSSE